MRLCKTGRGHQQSVIGERDKAIPVIYISALPYAPVFSEGISFLIEEQNQPTKQTTQITKIKIKIKNDNLGGHAIIGIRYLQYVAEHRC